MRRNTLIGLVIGIFLACAGVGALVFVWVQLARADARANALRASVAHDIQREQKLGSTRALLKETAATRLELARAFVGSDDVALFLETLESVGAGSGSDLEISSIGVEDFERPRQNLERLRVTITAFGSWSEIATFIRRVEAFPVRPRITDARVTYGSDEQKPLWRLIMTLTVPKLK